MFIGHFAVALGVKSKRPDISLGTLFAASQFLDLLWPIFLLAGVESVAVKPGITAVAPFDFVNYPISHSLLTVIGWGILFSAGHFALKRNLRNAVIVGLCVVSHWVLDLIVHIPDLPLYPGNSPKVGLGLWNSFVGSQLLETAMFVLGLMMYLRSTRPMGKAGIIGIWSLTVFLLVIHAANLFSPPPTDVTAIAYAGHAQWLLVLWAWWADKRRTGENVAV